MKTLTQGIWQSLWQSHRQTKRLLNVFAYQKDSAARQRTKQNSGEGADNQAPKPNSNKEPKEKKPYKTPQLVGLILGPVLFLLTLLFFQPDGLSFEGKAVLAVTLWVATWWITEAMPIPATSLLPIILLPLTGALESSAVASSYGNDIIFLFLGGFFIATAMEKWNLHKRLALLIISLIGTSTQRILLGFMVATGFLSMWVSNTAAVMMMIPMGLAITAQVADALKGKPEEKELPKFEKALIFGIGYAGTIGGLGTLIGTPPNIILAAQIKALFDVELSFALWMLFAAPVVVFLILFTWIYLGRFAFKIKIKGLPGGKEVITKERKALGKMSFEEGTVLVVFVVTALMWVTRELVWTRWFEGLDLTDGIIAMVATAALFLLPASKKFGTRILEWKDSKDIPWGVLLLFGGGLAIASGFTSSGLSDWMGEQLQVLDGMHIFIVILASTLLIMALTEITSNTATATMILPIVAALAVAINIHPYAVMVPCAMAANCAFMLPVGTPPNAIIFGTGKLKIIEMVRVGFIVNIIATVLIIAAVYLMLPLLWGIDLSVFPENFR
ncbi:SLC13 family permease [Alkalicoccobacillus gibsonii]|uniref:SLC13 family permease n=1 Tax=Alkalicoccobacillus gibsonii TaxID=79881 RepID=UPI001933A83C|nr:SLC13 family permease [Alkalicoccobacillus gibsonii]MBM0065736.1 SLC13/DASS family transporter [Alkalicoccobacillus gibsonii]